MVLLWMQGAVPELGSGGAVPSVLIPDLVLFSCSNLDCPKLTQTGGQDHQIPVLPNAQGVTARGRTD